jgi:hypothetical protein
MRWFGAVLDGLVTVTGRTEQLAHQSFGDQLIPCPGQVGADGKGLGSRVDVIELKILSDSASSAAAPKHLD